MSLWVLLKCKITIFKDLSVDYEEVYILDGDAPYEKATDSRYYLL